MVQSIARFWAKQTVSNQQLRRMNFQEFADDEDIDLYAVQMSYLLLILLKFLNKLLRALWPEQAASSSVAEPPNAAEGERWKAKLMHFHKAADHCSSPNLRRIVRDADLEKWRSRWPRTSHAEFVKV